MPRFICLIIALLSVPALANQYTMDLYEPSDNRDGSFDFFTDTTFLTTCIIEVGDEDTTFPPNTYISIQSPDFKRLDCDIQGADKTYSFTYGSAVARPDFWNGVRYPTYDLGLLFDGSGKPLRFDSPQIATDISTLGWYDSPEEGYTGFSYDSYWGLQIDDDYQVPAAVLLEDTTIGSATYQKGRIVSSDLLPIGAKAFLINGRFYFDEQYYQDDTGDMIVGAYQYNTGYYTFDDKLSIPEVKITQAVFQEGDGPITLVDKRTTAILVKETPLGSVGSLAPIITQRSGNDTITIFPKDGVGFEVEEIDGYSVFYCNKNNSYCNLNKNSDYEVGVDSEDSPSNKKQKVSVKESGMLELFYFHLLSFSCEAQGTCSPEAIIEDEIRKSNIFISKTFPVADAALLSTPDPYSDSLGTSYKGKKNQNKRNEVTFDLKLLNSVHDQIRADIRMIDEYRTKKSKIFQRSVGIVESNYFKEKLEEWPSVENSNLAYVEGVTYPGMKSTLVTVTAGANATAHEIGHTFGLGLQPPAGPGEEYELAENGIGFNTEGFDIYPSQNYKFKPIESTFNFMSKSGLSEDEYQYWVDAKTWNNIFNKLSVNTDDPRIIYLSFDLSKDDRVDTFNWFEANGYPDQSDIGSYAMQILAYDGSINYEYRFDPTFYALAEPIGAIDIGSFQTSILADYPLDSDTVVIMNNNEEIIYSEVILAKIVSTLKGNLLIGCDLPQDVMNDLEKNLTKLENEIKLKNYFKSKQFIEYVQASFTEVTNVSCNPRYLFDSLSEAKDSIDRISDRINFRLANSETMLGDLDFDGDIDRVDLYMLFGQRGELVTGEDDPRDIDGNGKINCIDVIRLLFMCTRSLCAIR